MKNFGSIKYFAGTSNQPGTTILGGDRLGVLASDKVRPLPGDRLNTADGFWTIIAIDPVNPAGIDLMYTCHLRA
jgi:hypothetical protein